MLGRAAGMEDHSEARGDAHGLNPVPCVELPATLRQQTQLLREGGANLAGLSLSLLSQALGFFVAHARILRAVPSVVGPELIRFYASLCDTTTCRPSPRGVHALRRHPRGSRS